MGHGMSTPEPSLKGRALRLLGGREYSRTELERKLKIHDQSPGLLAKALDELQVKGFIDDQRVVESVVHRRAAKLGAARIKQELRSKGLSAGTVKDAVSSLQATELERARAIWYKKFGAALTAEQSPRALSAAERGKQMRFLASRGFGADTIRRVVTGNSGDQEPMLD